MSREDRGRTAGIRGTALRGICPAGFASGCLLVIACGSDIGNLFPSDAGAGGGAGRGGSTSSAGQLNAGGDRPGAGAESGRLEAGSGGVRAGAGGAGGRLPASSAGSGQAGSISSAGSGGADPSGETAGSGGQGERGECGACAAPAEQCRHAECDRNTGQCVAVQDADGTSCDDGKACTAADVCRGGVCAGSVPALTLTKNVMAVIPDAQTECSPNGGTLSVSFDVTAPGEFGSASLELDFSHYYISDLEILLRHDPSGETQTLFSRPSTLGIHANGEYTFADGATLYPMDIEYQDLEPGAYAPIEPFAEAFEGIRIAGTWTLTISDFCKDDEGLLRRATLYLEAAACP